MDLLRPGLQISKILEPDSDGILGTGEIRFGSLGRRRGRSEVRCSERGWEGQGLGGIDQLCLGLAGPQNSGSMCASYMLAHHCSRVSSAWLSDEWKGSPAA